MLLLALFTFFVIPLAAQSPNTATMIVVVVDQTGALVKDAKVSVANTATGALREAVSGTEGSATIPALSMTGTYTVTVSKEGFNDEDGDLSFKLVDELGRPGPFIICEIIDPIKLAPPSVGSRVRVYGVSRYDGQMDHNWYEVHPVLNIEVVRP